MIADHITTVIVTDVGTLPVPQEVAKFVQTVPRRRDGDFDRRTRAAKLALDWQNRVKIAAFEKWEAGEELDPSELPPL